MIKLMNSLKSAGIITLAFIGAANAQKEEIKSYYGYYNSSTEDTGYLADDESSERSNNADISRSSKKKQSLINDLEDNLTCTTLEAAKKDKNGLPSRKSLQCISKEDALLKHPNFTNKFYKTHCSKVSDKQIVNEACLLVESSIEERNQNAEKATREKIAKTRPNVGNLYGIEDDGTDGD